MSKADGRASGDGTDVVVIRAVIEAEIERLIGLLDTLDGDPDVEPSLGWTYTMAVGSTTDIEDAFAVPL